MMMYLLLKDGDKIPIGVEVGIVIALILVVIAASRNIKRDNKNPFK